jgi:drug/metabolite transporter (DMT)-like permease
METLLSRIPKHTHGIAYFITAMLFFSLMNVLIRQINDTLPSVQLVFLRNIISFALFLPYIATKPKEELKTNRIGRHIFRASVGLIAMETWFYALTSLEVNIATAISFTAPLFTTIFAVCFLDEVIGRVRIITLIIGFCGVMIIANPFNATSFNPMMLIALFSTAMISAAGVIVKILTRTEPSWRIVFYMASFMSLLSFPPAYLAWQSVTQEALLGITAIAILSTIAQLCLAQAFAHSPMVVLMPFDFSRLIFTAAIAWIVLREPITFSTVIGSIVIITSAAYISWRDIKKGNADARHS